jgi:hypothetical protein
VFFAAVVGACFAVVIPLLSINNILAAVIKVLFGIGMCAVAAKYNSFKNFLKFLLWFFAVCGVVAGVLFGLFFLLGIEYQQGTGYILSSVPVGVPMFLALVIFLACKHLAKKLKAINKKCVRCHIYAGELCFDVSGFFDSGNSVYLLGEPVSIIPKSVAYKIIDKKSIKESVKIHTVAGSKKIDVFTCERLEIVQDNKTVVHRGVKLGIGGGDLTKIILHPDLLEE